MSGPEYIHVETVKRLSDMGEGEKGYIVSFEGGPHEWETLEYMGIYVGAEVVVHRRGSDAVYAWIGRRIIKLGIELASLINVLLNDEVVYRSGY